jgi:hypothetical protein
MLNIFGRKAPPSPPFSRNLDTFSTFLDGLLLSFTAFNANIPYDMFGYALFSFFASGLGGRPEGSALFGQKKEGD